jgi:tight adherence protein B
MTGSQLSLIIVVFFFIYGVMGLVPDVVHWYRERYRQRMSDTGREWDRFFIRMKPSRIITISTLVGVLFGLYTGSWVMGTAIAASGFMAPKMILTLWIEMRSAKVEAQLMDALILMSNTLKSGLDMAAAVDRVASTMKAPISEEFGLVMNAYRLGTPLEAALMDLTTRLKSRTLETVIYAINLQRETGGNIIKTFDQLVTTIREENKLQKKVRALTSQGRTQVVFLAVFPWALAVVFFFVSPDFMRPALQNPWAHLVLVLLIIWEGIGIMVTKKIVTVEI